MRTNPKEQRKHMKDDRNIFYFSFCY
ncbi:mCG1040834 [Mus musculus]|nr:mCG1040834 [Mus musculus]